MESPAKRPRPSEGYFRTLANPRVRATKPAAKPPSGPPAARASTRATRAQSDVPTLRLPADESGDPGTAETAQSPQASHASPALTAPGSPGRFSRPLAAAIRRVSQAISRERTGLQTAAGRVPAAREPVLNVDLLVARLQASQTEEDRRGLMMVDELPGGQVADMADAEARMAQLDRAHDAGEIEDIEYEMQANRIARHVLEFPSDAPDGG